MKQKFFKELSWSFLAKAATFVLFYALNIYLARVLGVNLFGRWSFFYSILSIIFLLSYFGINSSSKKYVAEHNKSEELPSVIRGAFSARFIFSFSSALLLFIFSEPIANVIGRPELTSLLTLSAPLVFLSGGVEFLKDVFVGLHRNKFNFVINLLEYGLKLFLVWFFFLFSIGLSSIINSFNISLFITLVASSLIIYLNYFRRGNSNNNRHYFKKIVRYSLPLFFISVGFWIATEIDTVMIGYLKSDFDVGIFSAAKQIVVKLPHIAVAISMGALPVFARLDEDNWRKLKALFKKILIYNSIIFGVIVLIILVFSDYLMPLIYGTDFAASATPLKLLTPYLLMFSFSIYFSDFLDYRGLATKRAINLSVAVILNIVLNYLLIPKYGVNGAAIATSASYLPYFVLNWLEVSREWRRISNMKKPRNESD